VGRKVGTLCLLRPWHARKWEGGRGGLLMNGRWGQSPLPEKRGRRTVHPVPPACTQRRGRCAGEVGHVNRGWGVEQPRWRGLSTNGKEGGGALSVVRPAQALSPKPCVSITSAMHHSPTTCLSHSYLSASFPCCLISFPMPLPYLFYLHFTSLFRYRLSCI